MEQEPDAAEKLRKNLSFNIKAQRKKLGLSQEKLAESADLSSQTINDIEGCRMWVSDKTIVKLARVFRIEAYQLLLPVNAQETASGTRDELLRKLEEKLLEAIQLVKK